MKRNYTHIWLSLTVLLTLSLMALPAPMQAAAPTSPTLVPERGDLSLSGQLVILWGDPSAGTGAAGETQYLLVAGESTVPLALEDGLALPSGGLLALNRRQVTVQGEWAGVPATGGRTVFHVKSVRLASPAEPPQAIVDSQPWISLMCKFRDIMDEPKDLPYFQGMYANVFPGLGHYWREVSYDQIDLLGSGAVGWYTLPQSWSYYVYDNDGDGEVELDWGRAADDCSGVADPDVYFPQYVGINLMFNANLDCCAWGGSWYLDRDGQVKLYRMTWEPPWGYGNIGVIAHETGHGFGLPHSSGQCGQVYDNRWDVMSDVWTDCGNLTDPTYGCVGQGTISYHRDLESWIPAERLVSVGTGGQAEITLERLDLPPSGNYLMARIPIEDSGSWYYTVEARQKQGYDTKLPAQGVIIHEVLTDRPEPAHVVDLDNDCDTGDAYLSVGQSFADAAHGITVAVDAATPTGWQVTISNRYNPSVPVHVRSIAMRYRAKNGQYLVNAAMRIVDPAHLPLGGALVSARWTLPNGSTLDQQATSAVTGIARFKARSALTGSYQVCVTGVTKAGYVYDPGQNHMTCRSLPVP